MNSKNPVFLCIGSEKISGDSLGPAVGDFLTGKYNQKCFVYGTTNRSVNGENLEEYLDFIFSVHKDSPVIAVDACLGKSANIGKIKISATGVCPKKAVTGINKNVGDLGILGVVGETSTNALYQLMTVPIVNVENLGDKIAFMLNYAISAI